MNLQANTNFRRGIRFEGFHFALGDFVLSCAQARSLGGSKQFIGVVAEVEYLPLTSIPVAKPILEVCFLMFVVEFFYLNKAFCTLILVSIFRRIRRFISANLFGLKHCQVSQKSVMRHTGIRGELLTIACLHRNSSTSWCQP